MTSIPTPSPVALDRLRVAVIKGVVIPEQLTLWRACRDMGADITVIGTDANIYKGTWPWQPRRPEELPSVLLDPITPSLARGQLWWAYRGLRRTLSRIRPDIIHITSEPWGALVVLARREGLRSVPTTVVPEIIPDPATFEPAEPARRRALRRRFDLPLDEVVVGYVGRLHEQKGIHDLLAAFQCLGATAPFLALWGAGPLQDLVERTLKDGHLRGRFGGALELYEVAEALQACDVLVVPSRTTPEFKEQFGRVIVEAMLAGCAVVASRSGAIPEVVGDSARLVDEGDVTGLAATIQQLVSDPSARQELAAKGRQQALRRFHPNVLARKMMRFWSEVITQ